MIFVFYSAAGCGRDISDRSIMWIRTQPVPIEDEADAIMASIVYFTAVHADLRSLREGITFALGENDIFNKVDLAIFFVYRYDDLHPSFAFNCLWSLSLQRTLPCYKLGSFQSLYPYAVLIAFVTSLLFFPILSLFDSLQQTISSAFSSCLQS